MSIYILVIVLRDLFADVGISVQYYNPKRKHYRGS